MIFFSAFSACPVFLAGRLSVSAVFLFNTLRLRLVVLDFRHQIFKIIAARMKYHVKSIDEGFIDNKLNIAYFNER